MSGSTTYRIDLLSFDQLDVLCAEHSHNLSWHCPFVLPFWLKTWFSCFGGDDRQKILALWSGKTLLGVAPLKISGRKASFMGSESVCDFQDMIVARNQAEDFYKALFYFLEKSDFDCLELAALKSDSAALVHIPKIARQKKYPYLEKEAGNLYALELPDSWEAYLSLLTSKQRHEVRRKLRRLNEYHRTCYRVSRKGEWPEEVFYRFLEMFIDSRDDKKMFLDQQTEDYFSSLAQGLTNNGMLQIGTLFIAEKPASSVFSFTWNDEVFLYNNGYYKEFSPVSAGIICKILSIKHSIENGAKRYNFLKGDERYKKQLGGQPLQLFRLTVRLRG